MTRLRHATSLAALLLVAACTGEPAERSLGPACSDGLDRAERELGRAKANGVGDAVRWSKAAGLIAAARVQEGFEEYQNCVIKVRDARAYIRAM